MKKTLFYLFFLLTLSLWAQDGINYQGAATDVNGDELTSQNISIRASVLSTSANGNLEWEETHSSTTDQFGLFNVVIGQGTNTTNGATANFNDMNWGSGNHFLKIEMDAAGGTNYVMIGTTQMMSVPYALYAKSAGIDSTMLANMIGSSVGGMGGGCDYQFPEGLHGDPVIVDVVAGYTIPSGKNLYITSSKADVSGVRLIIGGIKALDAGNHQSPMIANSGDIVNWFTVGNIPTSVYCMGILVDQNPQVQIISIDLMAGDYTVPSSKKMVIYHGYHEGNTGYINVNGELLSEAHTKPLPLFLNAGDIVSMSGNPTYTSAFGYLVDENYFANCGGGGSSTASTGLDSATVASMIASAFNSSISVSVGDYFQGGIVAYIFQPGDYSYVHGEVHGYVSYSDGSNLPWGCDGIATSINNTNIGQGITNTQNLVNLCQESNFAAKWCDDLILGIYDDWFLPNSEEMLLAGLSFIKDYFGDYTHFWTSVEFSASNPYNYTCPSCSSAANAFTYYIDGTPSMNLNSVEKWRTEKIIAFRQF